MSKVPDGLDISKIFSKKNEKVCLEKNVQKSFDGGASVAKTYPGPTYQVGERLITSWKILIDKLESLSKSNSTTTLPTGSTEILKAIGLLNKFGTSPNNLLLEWVKIMPKYSEALKSIVSNVSGIIKGTQHINEAITNVASDIVKLVKEFQNLKGSCDRFKRIDAKPLIKSTQILTNRIANIAETSLEMCGLKADVYEAIAIVTLILHSIVVGCMGTYTNIAAILYSEDSESVGEILNNCLLALTQLVQGMANSINSMTNTVGSISVFLKDFVELNNYFNDELCSFGLGLQDL